MAAVDGRNIGIAIETTSANAVAEATPPERVALATNDTNRERLHDEELVRARTIVVDETGMTEPLTRAARSTKDV